MPCPGSIVKKLTCPQLETGAILHCCLGSITVVSPLMINNTFPVQLITPKRFGDARGWFTEVYSEPTFAKFGIDCRFVQDNHSLSVPKYTLRGMHFQTPPRGQDKLVRCVRGAIFDVAVDIRKGSPTYGQWVGAELSAENGHQFFIPIGFAHGFVTLEDNCEVSYKCSDTYAPDCDGGIRWNDPTIGAGGIGWPMPTGTAPELSAKDALQPLLADFDSPFAYDGRPLVSVT
jgi:dTDP-4-dehydrorhamnose 3,5-epimerase